jgi:endonuclease YncB( thermonuclease family)
MKYLIFVLSILLLGCDHPESTEYSRESKVYKSTTQNDVVENENKSVLNKVEIDTSILYKVVGITDGDTYKLLKDDMQIIIRSAHLNCPEKNQPFGQKAKQFVSYLCFGKYVTLRHNNKYDRNHRLIAEVILENGSNLNKLIVENGLAWHYKRFSKDEEYAELEIIARQNKIGLWIDTNPIDPDEWRHR